MFIDRVIQKALLLLAAALSLLLASCAASTEFYRDVERDLGLGKYEQALQEVRKNRDAYGDKSTVLFHLDMGMLFHYADQPDSSIAHFLIAEKHIEDLYTKSISLAAMSLLLNDNVLPYDGEDFEKVMVNAFLALDFAQKGETDEALVEARKVDVKLRELARQYEGKNRYQEDAFVRYIAGALYESDGEVNDAFISYRKAFEAYESNAKEYGVPAPKFLLDDLVRCASRLSFDEEAALYRSKGGKESDLREKDWGSILVVTCVGRAPVKIGERIAVSIPDSAGTIHTFQVEVPKFVPRYINPRSYEVVVASDRDTIVAPSEPAQSITEIARKALEDRLALVYLKSGGRAVLKFLAAEKYKSELKKKESVAANVLGSIAIDLVVGATERADLRGWRTLPAEVHVARIRVPRGVYSLTVTSSDNAFAARDVRVSVASAQVSFVVLNDIR